MNCQHCCGANEIFDLKRAEKEFKKYTRKGPRNPTAKLIKRFDHNSISDRTLLDIGGGIGAIQWFFLENGAKKTTDVDASSSYLKVAADYSSQNGWQNRSNFFHGDFVETNQTFESYDFVTLDKVVCCYPEYQSLLLKAASHCNDTLALTFPVRNLISRFLILLSGLYFYLKNNPFRTYIHRPSEIRELIRSCGFEPIYADVAFPWHVQIYRRVQSRQNL